MPKLIVISGADTGREFELVLATTTVGRHSGNAIYLSDNRVSRRHLEVRTTKSGRHQLYDLRSGNGTLVNGRLVQVVDLQNDDLIHVGDTVLKYALDTTVKQGDSTDSARVVVRPQEDVPSSILRTVDADVGSRLLSGPDRTESEWLRARLATLGVIYETTTAVSRIHDVDELLGKIMDLVMRTTDADNGCVMLADAESGELMPKAVRSREGTQPSHEFVVSRTVVDYVLREGHGVLVADAGSDERFRSGESIARHRIREVICVPMKGRHETVGVLFLDTRGASFGLPGIGADLVAAARRTKTDPEPRPNAPPGTVAQITTLVMTPGPRAVPSEAPPKEEPYLETAPKPEKKPSSTPTTFSEDHLTLAVAIAHQAAIAVEGTRYYNAMIQTERLAAVGQTIAALSHHIKNIMQGVRFGGDMVRMGFETADGELLKKGWRLVEKNQSRIDDLILDMLSYSKDREPALELTDLNGLVEDVLETVGGRAIELGVRLERQAAPDLLAIACDTEGIHRAVLNIVSNAIDAVSGCELPQVSVLTRQTSDGDFTEIIIQDNGPGIPEDKRDEIFKPFVSTKGSKGTGLGLPVSRKILREHGGDVLVSGTPGRGSIFTLRLPSRRETRGDIDSVFGKVD